MEHLDKYITYLEKRKQLSVICLGNSKLNGGSGKYEIAKAETKEIGSSRSHIISTCPGRE